MDWKSNWLGDNVANYESKNLEKAMKEDNYFLQAAIYTKALKSFLKIVDKRKFEEIFGGVFYIFLRGLNDQGYGIYKFFPKV